MIRIYVAGPIRAHNEETMFTNIQAGIRMSIRLISRGHAPYCPHLDYSYLLMNPSRGPKINIKKLQEYCKEWLKVCHAVLVLPKSRNSKGVREEIKLARTLKIPVFYTYEALISQLRRQENERQ